MRTTAIWSIILALVGVASAAGESSARSPKRLRFVGYRIVVVPEVVEGARGRLTTKHLTWQLRAAYVTPAKEEILVVPAVPAKDAASLRDNVVDVERRAEPSDFVRFSELFDDFDKAVRRFKSIKGSVDVTVLGSKPGRRPIVVKKPKPKPDPKPNKKRTCTETLIEIGHHPSHLSKCRGVNDRCGVALLRLGHHPDHLNKCRGVGAKCAVGLLKKGHAPSHLPNCTIDLRPRCAVALLKAGHHPSLLDRCSGVEEDCAVALLRNGNHPSELRKCRK